MGFLLLGVDSLIACFAVGALVKRQSWLLYATLFGLCDAGGFLLGTALKWNMPDGTAKVIETAVLVGLGVYWLGVALYARRLAETRWVWALPVVLSIDNIGYGLIDHAWSSSIAVQAIEQFISSSLLACIGLLAGAAVMRAIPGPKQRGITFPAAFAGAALIVAAPVLLAVG
jgi:putative Mn2+ efflux pump MntP